MDGADSDAFGWSVSISGDVVVVGAPNNDGFRGAAYVFERHAGGIDNWGQVKNLIAFDREADDGFGRSVAVSGDVVVVGAESDRVGDNSLQGSAYVFERNTGGNDNWGQVGKLTANDAARDDLFGSSVAVNNDIIVVGAPQKDFPSGAAYVFQRNATGLSFSQVKRLNPRDGQSGGQFGRAVSVSGSLVVVGAPYATVGSNFEQGSVFVFERDAGGTDQWGEVKHLIASDGEEGDQLGYPAAVSGDVVLIAAPWDDVGGVENQGSVYVFERDAGGADNWGQTQKLSANDGAPYDLFGSSVGVSGDVAVVGMPNDTVGSNAYQGSAHVYWGPSIALLAPMLGTGEFQVTVSGPAGQEHSLQVSSNLVDWVSVTNVILSPNGTLLSVPATGDSSFYRALLLPGP
jgi:hypothetical protein